MEQGARIYVAGHAGMVGSALIRLLELRGYGNIITAGRDALDLTDSERTHAFLMSARPEYVFFAAGKVGGILANTLQPTEFLVENLAMQQSVLLASRDAGVRKLLFFGSACIYPRSVPQPIREDSLLSGPLERSNEAYAIAKIAGISLCRSLRRQYGCNFVCAMPTNLYGPGDTFHLQQSHVIPALIQKIHHAKERHAPLVEIWGSGTATRDFLHVDDCAEACVKIMDCYDEEEIINIGTGTEVSIREIAETIASVVGYKGKLQFDKTKLEGVPQRFLDVRKLQALGWGNRIGLKEGLQQTYRWYLSAMEAGAVRSAATPHERP